MARFNLQFWLRVEAFLGLYNKQAGFGPYEVLIMGHMIGVNVFF